MTALHEKLLRSNSKNAELNGELEAFDKLTRFNDTQEQIVYIVQQSSQLFAVTIEQDFKYNGRIQTFDLYGYVFEKHIGNIFERKSIAHANCKAVYDINETVLKSVHIIDFVVKESRQNQGYGSIIMEQLIRYAKFLKASYISGDLSFVDIGISDDDKAKRKSRERLYHFYPKFGFELDKDKGTIRLDLTK